MNTKREKGEGSEYKPNEASRRLRHFEKRVSRSALFQAEKRSRVGEQLRAENLTRLLNETKTKVEELRTAMLFMVIRVAVKMELQDKERIQQAAAKMNNLTREELSDVLIELVTKMVWPYDTLKNNETSAEVHIKGIVEEKAA